MYDPNVFTLNLEQLLSGAPLDAAIGVVQITIDSARGIKGTKIGGGSPDPYISLSLNNREELATTKYKTNRYAVCLFIFCFSRLSFHSYNPTWAETKFILVNSLNESLILSLYDYNDHRKNALLSSASFELALLQEDATREGIESTLMKDGKDRGVVRYDISYYPVIKPEEGKEELLETSKRVPENVVPPLIYLFSQPSASCVSRSIKQRNSTNPSRFPETSTRSQSCI
jgi:Ca2+-dependent lipid-binding protein